MSSCPHCGADNVPAALECARCGIVFAKAHAHSDLPPHPAIPAPGFQATVTAGERVVRVLTVVALAVWTWQLARRPMTSAQASVLHLPNLIFHEAGHVIFGFFGRFITVLGGSLNQVLVPLVCAIAFLRQENPFAAAVCAWWAGENLLDLAPYIADARALQLVLIGGHTGAEVEGHDWEYLLTQLRLMPYDVTLGHWAAGIGVAIMVAAIAWGASVTARGQLAAAEFSA